MRVMFVALNRETHPYPVQPIGLAYMAQAVRHAGHDILFLDTNLREHPLDDLEAAIAGFRPEVIAMGLRNIDNCAFPLLEFYLPWALEVTNRCRELSRARLVVGGSGFAVLPREVLDYLDIDIGVLGEGERSFVELLANWEGDHRLRLPTEVGGLALREGGHYRETPGNWFPFAEQAFFPARELLDMPAYLRGGSMTAVQTKRGCAMSCSYCTYPLIEGRNLRMRSARQVGDELEALHKDHGVTEVFFTDNVFNNPISHALDICREIVRRDLDLSWTAFFNPAFMSEELAEWAARSGCSGIEFGTEGGSAQSLKALRKGFKVKTLVRSNAIAVSTGLPVAHYLIVGSPGETLDIVREGLDLIASLNPTAVLASTGIRIYPRTHIAKVAAEEGYNIDNLLVPQFYFPEFMRNDPATVIASIAKEYPRFRFEGFHSRPTLELLQALRKRGHRGPTWRMQGLLGRLRDTGAGAGSG